MKYKLAIVLIALVAAAIAQAPSKMSPEKPSLRDSFSKTCLKALLAIRDFKGNGSLTGPAKDAYENARVKASSSSVPETLMIANLTNFAMMRSPSGTKSGSCLLARPISFTWIFNPRLWRGTEVRIGGKRSDAEVQPSAFAATTAIQ